jgi:DNA-binding transcriptional regulator LsrR (DeoR family)
VSALTEQEDRAVGFVNRDIEPSEISEYMGITARHVRRLLASAEGKGIILPAWYTRRPDRTRIEQLSDFVLSSL